MLKPVDPSLILTAACASYFDAFTFPLAIGQKIQQGYVYADSDTNPGTVLAAHPSGFSYLCTAPGFTDFDMLLTSLNAERKLPVYMHICDPALGLVRALPSHPSIGHKSRMRLRMRYLAGPVTVELPEGIHAAPITSDNIADVHKLNNKLIPSFWDSDKHFLAYGPGALIYEGAEPISVCYSASTVNKQAEVDIFTHPGHERRGLGKIATGLFINACLANGITPIWDAFVDNVASVNVATKMGFTTVREYLCLSLYFNDRAIK
jgi:RimJ/RimL family protein N-acetyltransferase